MGRDGEAFLQWLPFPTACKGYFPPGYFPPSPPWILSHTSHFQWKAETAFLNETTSFLAVFGRPGSPPCCMSCCSSVQPWNSCISFGDYCGRRPWSSLCILLLKMKALCSSLHRKTGSLGNAMLCVASKSHSERIEPCLIFLDKSHRPSSVPEVTSLKHTLRGLLLTSRSSRNLRASCKNSLPHTPPVTNTTGGEESLSHLI